MYANRCGSQSGPTAAGRLYSRRATNLTPYFPDLAPVLAARLPDDLVLDGEIVAWDTTAGRLDFASLQNRMTAGRRLRAVVERRPAQFVAFDVLAADGKDLRPKALRDRRRVLERALSGLASPIVLCQQTTDAAVAEEWMSTLTAGGVEGLVIKDASSTYPARDGSASGGSGACHGLGHDAVGADLGVVPHAMRGVPRDRAAISAAPSGRRSRPKRRST